MIKIFRCSYCNFESKNKEECLEHEQTHAMKVSCVKVQRENEVACTMKVLDKGDIYEVTFAWDAKDTGRSLTSVYAVSKEAVEFCLPEQKNAESE